MAKMKLPKPSPETIAYFERIAPGPPIEARKLFGMPARFLNGHMLVGLFGDTFMLHLSESDRQECIRAGAKPFAPMGREAKEYVDLKPGTFDDRTLKEWIVRGMRYLGKLPPKLKSRATDGAKSERAAASSKPDGTGTRRAAPKAKPKRGRTATPKTAQKAKKKAPPVRAVTRGSSSRAKKATLKGRKTRR